MLKSFLICTVGNRVAMLMDCLRSIAAHEPSDGWYVYIVAQGFDGEQFQQLMSCPWISSVNDVSVHDDELGPHRARVTGMKHWASDVWVQLDDDIELLPETDYSKMIDKISDPSVGFLSGGWVRALTMLPKKLLSMKDEFIKQSIVYTGGGLMHDAEIAELVCAMPEENYFDDNSAWSAEAYVNGYRNFRYRGSVALHKICSVGGLHQWKKDTAGVPPNKKYMEMAPCADTFGIKKENNWKIGDSSQLTDTAHEMHKRNKRW